uniref:USP domain-containing protein n=1 Tax=Sphaeramia orbicularis TaxID=375764 RepID=A0A672ZEJ6_9TELE
MNMDHDLVKTFKDKLSTLSDYHGLSGPGLTCYLNSVLQVLFMTPDFREAIQTCRWTDVETIDPYLRELFAHLEKNQARTHHIAATLAITDVYKQRDAAEYLEKILCLTSPQASKIFRGELNHVTICSRCKDRNEATTCFRVLPLSVEESHPTYSVDKGLDQFFRGQTVSGDNKMYCNNCQKKTDAFIKCELTGTPDVLILLLKRFHFDSKLMRFVKLHHDVDVTHTLHIKGCTYELYALINHCGSLTGGHYTARIRSFDTGAWYDFNDNTVQLVEQPLCEAGKTSVRYLYLFI